MSLPIMPKRLIDFATLGTSATQDLLLADRVELLDWRQVTLHVRVHSHTLTGSNTIAIRVYPQSWTPEEPGQQFPAFTTPTVVTIGSATPSPALLTIAIPTVGDYSSGAIASMARFTAFATRGGAGAMQASITLELMAKDA
jgi:hypothetical protein